MLVFLSCTFRPICTFTTAPCVISTRHCRCNIQYRTDPMATVRECNYTALIGTPDANPVHCLLSFHDRISPGLHIHTTYGFSPHSTLTYHTGHEIPFPLSLSFIGHYAILPNSLSLAPLTLCFMLWPLATSLPLRILGTVEYSFNYFVMMLRSCVLLVDACSSPISISGIAQNQRVLFPHYWFWAAFPPAGIYTYFLFFV